MGTSGAETRAGKKRAPKEAYYIRQRDQTPELRRGIGRIMYQLAFANLKPSLLPLDRTDDGIVRIPQEPMNKPAREYVATFLANQKIQPYGPVMQLMDVASVEIAVNASEFWAQNDVAKSKDIGGLSSFDAAEQVRQQGLDATIAVHHRLVSAARTEEGILPLPL